MAKRYPLSAASKAFGIITNQKGYPELLAQLASCKSLDAEQGIMNPFVERYIKQFNALNIDDHCSNGEIVEAWYRMARYQKEVITPSDLTWASRWYKCRQVYRIPQDVAGELENTNLDDEIPTDILNRLPYPIIFIEGMSIEYDGAGFLAYPIIDNGITHLGLTTIKRDGIRIHDSLTIDGSMTLRELVEQKTVKDLTDDETYERVALNVSKMINALLYIISSTSDVEVLHTPPSSRKPGQKSGRKTNPETIRLIGAKMGRAIHAAKRQNGSCSPSKSTVQAKAPHVRAAHWSHYWVGPRKNRSDGKPGDRLELKWIPPINVNENHGEVVETIHL